MCYKIKQTTPGKKLEKRFKAKIADKVEIAPSEEINAFAYPSLPVILNDEPDKIQLLQWGLIPESKGTLNARIETLSEKPTFQKYLHQKCLVLINGFYEYQWLDSQGKKTQKYLLSLPEDEPFALAGLWSLQKNAQGEEIKTFTIITTEARGIMTEIHNSKLRQPVILAEAIERDWLMGIRRGKLNMELIATKI